MVALALVGAGEALPECGFVFAVLAGQRRPHQQGPPEYHGGKGQLGDNQARAFTQPPPHTSCWATCSPSRLMATRVLRSSTSSS